MGMGRQGQRPEKGEEAKGVPSDERTCLRSKKDREDRVCLIQSKLALVVLTRVVFVVLTISCGAVITTSIWLMLNCRESFAMVRPMIPEHALFCTNMGMPALFACCTFLFTVFGLGCTGRRLTGYALIIISSVEILQSVTTLAFYKCNTIDHKDILDTVNTSLTACHRPLGLPTPLFFAEAGRQQSSTLGGGSRAKREAKLQYPEMYYRIQNASPNLLETTTYTDDATIVFGNLASISTASSPKPNVYRESSKAKGVNGGYKESEDVKSILIRLRDKKLIEEFNNKMRVQTDPGQKPPGTKASGIDRSRSRGQYLSKNNECSNNNPFFSQLSLKVKESEVHECLEVCQTYLAVCPPSRGLANPATRVADSNTVTPTYGSARGFDSTVLYCGDMVKEHVNDLCFYNDEIIIPISICAPTLYICLSLCFIYLCRCDRRVKEFGPAETASKSSSSSSDPPKRWTWRMSPCCTGESYGGKSSSPWSCESLRASLPLKTGLSKSSHGAFSPNTLSSECSSDFLIQMREMPETENSGATVSQGASRDTLNTLLSDEQPSSLGR